MIIFKGNYRVHLWYLPSKEEYKILLPHGFIFEIDSTNCEVHHQGNVVDNTMNIQYGVGWRKGYIETNYKGIQKRIEKDIINRFIEETNSDPNYLILTKENTSKNIKEIIQQQIDEFKAKNWYRDGK